MYGEIQIFTALYMLMNDPGLGVGNKSVNCGTYEYIFPGQYCNIAVGNTATCDASILSESWLLHFFANNLGKAAKRGSDIWVPVTHVRDLGRMSGSWCLLGPAAALAAI